MSRRRHTIAAALGCSRILDEYARERITIQVARTLNNLDMIKTLADAILIHDVPEHIHSDNGRTPSYY